MTAQTNTLLDALTVKGVLISVSIRYWRARKKLRPEDLGLDPDTVDDRLFSLGHKKLLPKEALAKLALIESRAHALVEANTFPFLGGIAHYLPNAKLQDLTTKLEALRDEFDGCRDEFIARYGRLRQQALDEWRRAAETLTDDPERMLGVIADAFPDVDRIENKFSFDIRTFQIAVPEAVPQAQLVELGTQQEVIEARRQAVASARHEIEASCRDFIGDCVATLREETAKLCDEMLATINSTGYVHQKTLNRLVKFIDQFKELNFVNDTEMERQLEKMRGEFLSRTAQEYRDSDTARGHLVKGLRGLRRRAAEMAHEDAGEIVENFGRLGQRRFQLAA
ncbi:MAG: DUF3150 domain-containing protein [Candidatus Pacebacteria bacterium]|nr:DUF3150 domain-containing protein [Candidatus Paceibacterota bacterium]